MRKFEHLSKTKKVFAVIGMGIGGFFLVAGMALLFGFVVMYLWNWLMPTIFGLTKITFWQAWGLVVLSHILFKSFPHNRGRHHHSDHWKERFKERCCSPEEKETTDSKDEVLLAKD
jgi:hypothetical protein